MHAEGDQEDLAVLVGHHVQERLRQDVAPMIGRGGFLDVVEQALLEQVLEGPAAERLIGRRRSCRR